MAQQQKPRIAIIGAGPSGLTLARILHINGIDAALFELEASANARSQGGSLDLHPATGQAALRKAGLFEQFEKHCRYDGEDMVVADRFGKVHAEVIGQARGKPEIDRRTLRQILLDSVPKDMIRWGSKLKSADATGTLHFDHGIESGFDLVVGGDGAWSKVRTLVTPFTPFYSSVSAYDIRISDIDSRHPRLGKLVGRGSYFAFGEETGQMMLCQRQGDGSVRIYAGFSTRESWIKDNGVDFSKPAEAREAILRDFEDWAPELRDLIKACDDEIIPRALYMLPVGAKWNSQKNVTVIGDAAHLMTPFAGEGVNVAMADAMKLAEAILKQPQDVAAAIKEYETWMFAASTEMTTKTWNNLINRFMPGGVADMAKRVNASVAKAQAQAQAETKQGKPTHVQLQGDAVAPSI